MEIILIINNININLINITTHFYLVVMNMMVRRRRGVKT